MDGASFTKTDDRSGYLTQDEKGKLTIDPNGIRYHDQKTYVRLLPFPTQSRDEYHAGTDDFFYITSGGRMHVYEILPFELRYRNHSVRSTSRNFIGTYSGVYYRGRKLDRSIRFPDFMDGQIREFNGKAFLCYSSLLIADLHQGDSLPTAWLELPEGFTIAYATDVRYSDYHRRYFVAAKTDLLEMDQAMTRMASVYRSKGKDAEVVLLGENRGSVYFASGREFLAFKPATKETRSMMTLPEPILDGHIDNLNQYLLSSTALYAVRADGSMKKLTDLTKAHTLLKLGGSEFAISTDAGLFLYHTSSNKLSELIRGVEFNRMGLSLRGDSLFAGSIDGLYVLDARNLEQLSERTSKLTNSQPIPGFVIGLLIGLAILTGALSYLLYRSRKRLKRVIQEAPAAAPPKLTREDIETFIRENLAMASLKSIAEKFQTNNAVLYTLLDPEKPGAFINRLRMEQVHRLRKEKRTAREISQQTGFSEYYVRKVWNNREEE
jgi:AraC-like DNA-binding protein